MNKLKIKICTLEAHNDKYISMIQYKCRKTELYAIITADVRDWGDDRLAEEGEGRG